MEGVGAALGDEVHSEAAGLHGEIAAAGGDVDLLEGVEVEVGRGRAGGGHVRDVEAVERPHLVAREGTLARDRGLLAVLVAGDVDAIDHGACNLVHDGPGIAGVRRVLQVLTAQNGAGAALLDVDDGGFGRRLRRSRSVRPP